MNAPAGITTEGAYAAGRCAGKRIVLHLFDAFSLSAVAAIIALGFAQPAYAYVDPSVMTYTIQALAGVAVALSAVAGVAFRRTRKALVRTMGIDENARKQADMPLIRIEPDDANISRDAASILADAAPDGTFKGIRPDSNQKTAAREAAGERLPWPKRAGIALAASVFTVFTLGFVAPIETVAGSSNDLVFGLHDVWPLMLPLCVAAAVAIALVCSILRGKAFSVAVALLCALGVCFWAQAMFLNSGIPLLDGVTVAWQEYRRQALLSLVVWTAVIALAVWVGLRFQKPARLGVLAVSAALIAVQGIGIASLFIGDANSHAEVAIPPEEMYVTEKGLFTISEKENVIVLVLDTFDSKDVDRVWAAYPDLFDEWTGFTWYRDCTGSLIPTRYAIPFLLTGETPDAVEDAGHFTTYWNNRYTRSSFLADMNDLGYSVGLYSDSIYYSGVFQKELSWPLVGEKTINIRHDVPNLFDRVGIIKSAMKMALYRDLTWSMKPFFRFTTNEANYVAVRRTPGETSDDTAYVMDDYAYYQKLLSNDLRYEEGDYAGAFRFIHLDALHEPYVMNEDMELVGSSRSSEDKQCVASVKMVDTYLGKLKEMGQYDNATIIITADHGDWYFTDHPLEEASSPIMFVKPGHQTADEAAAELDISTAPVSHMDFCATVIKAMGGDETPYGVAVEDVPDAPRTRYYYMTTTYINSDDDILEYRIEGDALDIGNWELTGVGWYNIWGTHTDRPQG